MHKIISPATLEHCCRHIIATNSKLGAQSVRIALAASIAHGNDWFPVNNVYLNLASTRKVGCSSVTGLLAQRLVHMGIAETRLQASGKGFSSHVARLTCKLVDQSHFHGQKSLKLFEQIETYYGRRPDASPVAALLLIGLHVFHIHHSRELGRFIEPESSVVTNPSICGRTICALQEAGLLAIDRSHECLKRPYLVYPL